MIIDDVSSFLTPRLVQELQRATRMVLGVFDPADGQDGKEHLRGCGVDQVIESGASAEEFVVAVGLRGARSPSSVSTSRSCMGFIGREVS